MNIFYETKHVILNNQYQWYKNFKTLTTQALVGFACPSSLEPMSWRGDAQPSPRTQQMVSGQSSLLVAH